MTNEEVIKNIVAFAYYIDEPIPEEVTKSFDIAIKALEEIEEIRKAYESDYQIDDVIQVCVKLWG